MEFMKAPNVTAMTAFIECMKALNFNFHRIHEGSQFEKTVLAFMEFMKAPKLTLMTAFIEFMKAPNLTPMITFIDFMKAPNFKKFISFMKASNWTVFVAFIEFMKAPNVMENQSNKSPEGLQFEIMKQPSTAFWNS